MLTWLQRQISHLSDPLGCLSFSSSSVQQRTGKAPLVDIVLCEHYQHQLLKHTDSRTEKRTEQLGWYEIATPRSPFTTSQAKLDNSIVNRYLSAADDDFVYCVDLDIRRFVERSNPKAVLIFPPFSSYRRFLVHRVCASKSFSQHDIVTFSIGIGTERRTVVCFRHQLLQDVKSSIGKSFEESTSSESATPAPKTQHYTSWRSSTTPPTGGTSTVTTVSSGCSGSSAPATTTTTGSINSALVSGQRTGENRIHPEEDQPNGNNGMGTETILLPSGGAVGVHQQQQRRQQHSSATTTNSAPPQSYLIDEETAFGDKLKGLPPHPDTYGDSQQQLQQPVGSNGAGVKFPPVVGIYRPPAARRALKLAENVVHQLAPPAACEHPNDYGHLRPSAQHHPHPPAHHQQALQLLLQTTTTDCTVPDRVLRSTPDSREGHLPEKETAGADEKTSTSRGQESLSRVPDAGRGIGSDSAGSSSAIAATSPTARTNRPHRERRPDRAVYVPRARRSLTTPPVVAAASHPQSSVPPDATDGGNADKVNPSPAKALLRTPSSRAQLPETGASCETASAATALPPPATASSKDPEGLRAADKGRTKSSVLPSGATDAPPYCDTVIDVPSDGSESVGAVSLDSFKKRSHSLEVQQQQSEQKPARPVLLEQNAPPCPEEPETRLERSPTETAATMQRNNQRNRNVRNGTMAPAPLPASLLIATDPNEATEKIDRDEKELRRASQEINRSNRRIMKQTFNSDVLEIGEPTPVPTAVQKPAKAKRTVAAAAPVAEGEGQKPTKTGVGKLAKDASVPNGTSAPKGGSVASTEEEEEDDWESMYDDNGDCLNPKMLEELTTAVGKVSIETPQSDYKSYETKQAMLNEEEFPHVLEVSSFPAEFKTQDLMMMFSQYKESGFDIKWVDDTHALAVFSSSRIAAEVLTTGLSFARVKPLGEATAESRSKARKCASSLQPYRQRPETCAAMARRMVSSALGVKLKTAPEERENERRVLREAKERKRLAAKQRDEIWDS
uniref:R3H domain-containing protein n=1 Tax=Anopheles merus TaxID=30066 RepID=A0A182VG20_ANOME